MSSYFTKSITAALLFNVHLHACQPPDSLADRVEKVLPSVVKIKIQRSDGSDDENDLIAYEGGGSGFVMDGNHHVLTNAHVIRDARKLVVIDANQREHPAVVLAKDDKTDIALLEAPTLDGTVPTFGKSEELKLGESIFVIGSPFSLGHSVSAGIVSSKGRSLSNYPYIPFIQTDASINPGNSGGPVFNCKGDLIAMASTYYSRQGNYTNIGFAIPAEDFLRIGEKLLKEKRVPRGYLGLELWSSEKIARKLGYPNALLVSRVDEVSPAAAGGIVAGDWIVGIENRRFQYGGELFKTLERSAPGVELTLSILREKKEMPMKITLGTPTGDLSNYAINTGNGDLTEKFGLTVTESREGIKILATHPWTKAVGLEPGDRIVSIDGSDIKTLKGLNQTLSKFKENDVGWITIQRMNRTVVLPFGSKTILRGSSTRD